MEDWTKVITPGMLTQRVDLDEHLTETLAPLLRRAGLPAHADKSEVLADKKRPYEALSRPGDEWWAWVAGTEPQMQMGGLALVRGGAIVWASMD